MATAHVSCMIAAATGVSNGEGRRRQQQWRRWQMVAAGSGGGGVRSGSDGMMVVRDSRCGQCLLMNKRTSRVVTWPQRNVFLYNIAHIYLFSSQQPPQNIKSMDCADCCGLPWTKNLWKSVDIPWTCGLLTKKVHGLWLFLWTSMDFLWTFCGFSVDKIYNFAVVSTQIQKVHGKSTKVHGNAKVHGVHGVHME